MSLSSLPKVETLRLAGWAEIGLAHSDVRPYNIAARLQRNGAIFEADFFGLALVAKCDGPELALQALARAGGNIVALLEVTNQEIGIIDNFRGSVGQIIQALRLEAERYPAPLDFSKPVKEEDWNQHAPYGVCPACGARAMEELAIAGDPDVTFFCSQDRCLTIMSHRQPARTKWTTDKAGWAVEKERQGGWSWNQQYFPGLVIPDICPD